MADTVIWGTKDFQVPEYFNFADVIDEWAQKEKEGKRNSEPPALWWIDGNGKEVKWSFQDVAFHSKKVANMLSSAVDIKPGDRVMAILPRIPEYWLMQTACLRTGGVYLITSTSVGPKELHRRIKLAKPVCVVTAACKEVNSELLEVVDQVVSSGSVNIRRRILINRIKEEQREGWLSYEDRFQRASADYQSVKSLSSAPCLILFTSGTTGNSKMVEHSQASFGLRGASIRIPRFEETDLNWTATSTGWTWLLEDGLFGAWSVGSGSFSHYKNVITAREVLDILQQYPITQAAFRTSVYMKALEEEGLERVRFLKLNRCFCGGQPVNKQMVKKWKKQTGIELWDTYGQTETGYLTFPREPDDDKHIGSCGKAFPGVDLLVVDDNNKEVPYGTLGRIVVRVKPYRPVNMFTCYVDEPLKTAACFSGDLYVTGDLGRMDADGHFWISGRADDMVICNAVNINPYEVERCLNEHPAVLDCAVVGSPRNGDQMLKAFVVLSSCFKNKNQDELIKELQDHVTYNAAEWMCPAKMEFMDDLPKTIVGKTDRRELRNRELTKCEG